MESNDKTTCNHLTRCQIAIGLWVVSVMFLVMFGLVFGFLAKSHLHRMGFTDDEESTLSTTDSEKLQKQIFQLQKEVNTLKTAK